MEPFTPAPPAAPPQTWYPPTPVPMAPRPPLPVNAVMALLGMVIGILLFVGLVTYHAIFLIPPPSSGFQQPSPAVTAYVNTVRTLGWVSVVAMDLAVAMSVMIAWLIGAIKGEVAESTRRGVFTFASIFLAIWIVFSFFGYTIFRGLLFPFG